MDLFWKKLYAIKFNQNAWLKPYIDVNTDVRKKAKIGFEKNNNNVVFGKTMKNVKKHRDIKPVKAERNYLASEPNYHTTQFFRENY